MATKNVLIELRRRPELELALGPGLADHPRNVSAAVGPLARIPGLTIDPSFSAVTVPAEPPPPVEAALSDSLSVPEPASSSETILVRGTIDDANAAALSDAVDADVIGIFADPVIEVCQTCINTPPVGTAADVARLLNVPGLTRAGMDGRGVMLAIVDTGININYLRSRGLAANFSAARSWVPPMPAGRPPLVPGQLPVDHGTMCAFDALIAAPRATLLDVAVLQSRRSGGSAMDGLLSDAVLGYSFLLRILREVRRPGDFHSMVVSNSWGMFRQDWDFPPGHPGNYSHNPAHPFNRIVATLERAGADILFAAGNCGRECPDGRCGIERDAGIYGANSHPAVLSVAGVDVKKKRVGYSTRGPGHLTREKPDICGYTHFVGSGVYPADGGTSAATPVVAGVVAAFRSRFPAGASRTPAALRDLVRGTAEDLGTAGFDLEHGFGIVNGARLSKSRLPAPKLAAADVDDNPAGPDEDALERGQDATSASDQEFLEALGAYDARVADAGAGGFAAESLGGGFGGFGGAGGSGTASNALGRVCEVYRRVRPVLQGVLRFIRLIPRIGPAAARAIETLMKLLDALCGTAGSASASDAEADFAHALVDFESTDVTAAPNVRQLCEQYRRIRPILVGILRFIERIPVIGRRAAQAIRTLMSALDALCGLGGFGLNAALGEGVNEEAEFARALDSFGAGGDESLTTAAPNLRQLCEQYRRIRPILAGILRFVERIPVIGQRAAQAIRALMRALDAICAAGGGGIGFGAGPAADDDYAFAQALSGFGASGGSDVAAAPSPAQLCGTYRRVRPILAGLLPFIRLIPQIGASAARAIETLMALLDAVCGGGTPAAGIDMAGDSAGGSAAPGDQEFLRALGAFG